MLSGDTSKIIAVWRERVPADPKTVGQSGSAWGLFCIPAPQTSISGVRAVAWQLSRAPAPS